MPRTKTYDPTEVLDRAKAVFWRKGYHDTSMEDLVDAMGISRYGIYTSFTSKHNLFLEVLQRYLQCEVGQTLAKLEEPDASLANITAFFDQLRAFKDDPQSRWGCLMSNSATEVAPHDADVAVLIERFLKRYTQAFARPLQRAKEEGQLAASLDVQATAQYLVGIVLGFSVYIRATTNRAMIDTYLTQAYQGLLRR